MMPDDVSSLPFGPICAAARPGSGLLSALQRTLAWLSAQLRSEQQPPGVLPRFAALALVGPSAWIALLLTDSYLTGGHRLGVGAAALVVEIGLRQSAWVVLSCGALLLLRHVLARRVWLSRCMECLVLA